MKFGNTNYRYVVIDDFDKSGTINGQEDNWITVNPHFGLTSVNAIEAIIILNDTAPIPIAIADELVLNSVKNKTVNYQTDAYADYISKGNKAIITVR